MDANPVATGPLVAGVNVVRTFSASARAASATRAVDGVTLSVGAGEFVSIVGPSGSGKSTLLYCLAGLDQVSSGQVVLLGRDVTHLSADGIAQVHRGRVGFVFQSLNLVTALSAIDNVLLPARLARRTEHGGRGSAAEAERLLIRLGIAPAVHRRAVSVLSGGERQRVAVARALFMRPQVVFADEPTGALDSASGELVVAALDELAHMGTGVVMVTHDLLVACHADRTVVMRDGQVIAHANHPAPAQLLAMTEVGIGSGTQARGGGVCYG